MSMIRAFHLAAALLLALPARMRGEMHAFQVVGDP